MTPEEIATKIAHHQVALEEYGEEFPADREEELIRWCECTELARLLGVDIEFLESERARLKAEK